MSGLSHEETAPSFLLPPREVECSLCCLNNVPGSQPEALLQIALRPDLSEAILHGDDAKTERHTADGCLHSAGQAADPVMVFRCHNNAGLFSPSCG